MIFFTAEGGDRSVKTPDIERLMNDYGTGLLRLCFLYLRDYHLAEDALQDTFVKAYFKYGTFKGNSSEKTWITSIAMNTCRSYLRRKSNRELPGGFDGSLPDGYTDTEETVEDREESMALLSAVMNLPEIYRQTVLLHYYSGFTTAEISRITKTNNATVKVRLMRARDMLRSALGDDFDNEKEN